MSYALPLPMPLYQCHKKVHALKIATCELRSKDDTATVIVTFEGVDGPLNEFTYDINGKPTPYAGWYLIEYEDGYISFSPPGPFEEGYTRIEATES